MSQPTDTPEAAAPAPETPDSAPGSAAEAAPAGPTLEQQLADAKAESARYKDQLLRTAADFDNFRKRSTREVTDGMSRAKEDLLRELLPVFDNLERALAHADAAKDVKTVVQGVQMIQRQLQDTLGRMGISRVPTVGQPFNPRVHEAVQQMASADQAPDTVLAEVQPGWAWGERLIRPAVVVVAKAPDEQPAEQG